MGEKYVNYGSKLFLVRDKLQKYKTNKSLIVLFTDAYDIRFFGDKQDLIKMFKTFEAKIVFGAEHFLNPEKDTLSKYPKVSHKGKSTK